MNPNDPTQPGQTPPPLSVDYLNQIAPQAQQRQRFKPGPKLFAVIGGALVILIIIVSIVVNVIVASQRHPLEQLTARLSVTEKLATDVKSNLKSSKLRSLNTGLLIYFTNTNRDIEKPLLGAGVNTKELSKSVLAEESGTAIADRLEDARLNGVLDRTYAREMAYKLSTILALLKQIHARYGGTNIEATASTNVSCGGSLGTCETQTSSLKQFAGEAYVNLLPTQKALAAFDETKL